MVGKARDKDALSTEEESQLDANLEAMEGGRKVEIMSRVEQLYHKECMKNQNRAQRFGCEYHPPNRYIILRDELKREKQNTRGLQVEIQKLKERKLKYVANVEKEKEGEGNIIDGDEDMDDFFLGGGKGKEKEKEKKKEKDLGGGITALTYATEEEKKRAEEKRKDREARFQMAMTIDEEGKGNIEEEERQRQLLLYEPPNVFARQRYNGRYLYQADEQRIDFLLDDAFGTVKRNYCKIHLYAIDSQAFLSMRTIDIMNLFHSFNPTYVEWLGDRSCNIEFANENDAAAALETLSVPSPTTKEMLLEMKETYAYKKKMKAEKNRLAKLHREQERRKKGKGKIIRSEAELNNLLLLGEASNGDAKRSSGAGEGSGKGKGENEENEENGMKETTTKKTTAAANLSTSTTSDVDLMGEEEEEKKEGKNEQEGEGENNIGADGDGDIEIEVEIEKEEENFRDLSLYGWYLGIVPITKIYTDEYGQKGISVRTMLRYATNNDVYNKPPEKRKRNYKYKKNITIDDPEMYKKLFQIGEEEMLEENLNLGSGNSINTNNSNSHGIENNNNNNEKGDKGEGVSEVLVEDGAEVDAQGLMEGESKLKRQKIEKKIPVVSPMSSKRLAGNVKSFASILTKMDKDKQAGVYKNKSLQRISSSKDNVTNNTNTNINKNTNNGGEGEGVEDRAREGGGRNINAIEEKDEEIDA